MILLAALTLAAAQPATNAAGSSSQPAASPSAPAADQAARLAEALARIGFSPAAVKILAQPLDTPAQRDAILAGLRQANAAIAAAAAAKPFDFAGFDKAIRDRQAIRADAENRRATQISDLIRRLPAADRPLFARTLLPRAPAPAPAASAPSK